MKKIIAVLLALVMMFSLTTVAFAETADETGTTQGEGTSDETTEGEDTTEDEPALGELDWLLDLPFWTVGPALKFAKIALKLVKVFVKVAMVFGIIDSDEIIQQIVDLIASSQEQTEGETTEPETTEPETTAPAAA